MTNVGSKQTPILKLAHLIFCIALLLVAFVFWYRYTPAREAWRVYEAGFRAKLRSEGRKEEAWATFRPTLDAVWPLAWPDLVLGGGVLLLFVFGTRVSAVRISYWLEARGSGEMASLRGVGLNEQTLDENRGRKGGLG
jgi:hypothetical protein